MCELFEIIYIYGPQILISLRIWVWRSSLLLQRDCRPWLPIQKPVAKFYGSTPTGYSLLWYWHLLEKRKNSQLSRKHLYQHFDPRRYLQGTGDSQRSMPTTCTQSQILTCRVFILIFMSLVFTPYSRILNIILNIVLDWQYEETEQCTE